MKFKDKKGNIFIVTTPSTIEEMKNSKLYEEVKENKENKEKDKQNVNK